MRQVLGPGALGRPRGIRVEREVGGGIEMGNTCKPMADSFQCMTKPTTKKKQKTEVLWRNWNFVHCWLECKMP